MTSFRPGLTFGFIMDCFLLSASVHGVSQCGRLGSSNFCLCSLRGKDWERDSHWVSWLRWHTVMTTIHDISAIIWWWTDVCLAHIHISLFVWTAITAKKLYSYDKTFFLGYTAPKNLVSTHIFWGPAVIAHSYSKINKFEAARAFSVFVGHIKLKPVQK